jgi:hypothetical protein
LIQRLLHPVSIQSKLNNQTIVYFKTTPKMQHNVTMKIQTFFGGHSAGGKAVTNSGAVAASYDTLTFLLLVSFAMLFSAYPLTLRQWGGTK